MVLQDVYVLSQDLFIYQDAPSFSQERGYQPLFHSEGFLLVDREGEGGMQVKDAKASEPQQVWCADQRPLGAE